MRLSGTRLCELLDTPYARFDTWKRKGWLPFDLQPGSWGTYTMREALLLAAAMELAGGGPAIEEALRAVRRNSLAYRDLVEGKNGDGNGGDTFHAFLSAIDDDGKRWTHQDVAFAAAFPQLPTKHAEALAESGILARPTSLVLLNLSGLLDVLQKRAEKLGFTSPDEP